MNRFLFAIPLACMFSMPALAQSGDEHATAPSDAQIAHIAYTAGEIDIAAARQALEKTRDADVRMFAEAMLRDHAAVNDQALALLGKLGVTPAPNPTSAALSADAAGKLESFAKLEGPAFDEAYVDNEVAFHKTVNDALDKTLIPASRNGELKALLQTGLKLFQEHELHAERLAAEVD